MSARRRMRAALAAGLAVLGLALLPGAAQAHVCGGTPLQASYKDIRGKGGDVVARLWYYRMPGAQMCKVLRAIKWKGTPHYMYLRSCGFADGGGPGKCSGWDAGKYERYAGPVTWPAPACWTRVIVDAPSGDRVVDDWFLSCD